MNFQENIKEGMRAVRGNMLRSVLTALIIAIGIMALVGILTAVDSIQVSVNSSFAQFGANSFEIEAPNNNQRIRRSFGPRPPDKNYPPISYRQAIMYKERMGKFGSVALSTTVSGIAEIKFGAKKTNPNVTITGVNENYFLAKNLDIELGRTFSNIELERGAYTAILGNEIAKNLFGKQSPIGNKINVRGNAFLVIGVLASEGSAQGGGADRNVLVPLETGRILATGFVPTINITTVLNNPLEFENTMGEATQILRTIRKDIIGQPNSFEISRSESAAERLNNITGYLKVGGGIVGFITLLGASIGLMNIMLVSVTERTREIGIRKALGATPYRIRQQFLIEAIVICQIGGIFGIILGILMGNAVASFISSGGFIVPWFWIVVALFVCVFVGVVSGWYPAYQASKLDPIESLRFE